MTAHRTLLVAVIAGIVAVPCAAEAAPRRVRWRGLVEKRVAGSALTPVKSDEAVQAILDRTPSGGVANLPQGTFRTSVVVDRPMTLRAHPRGTTFDGKGLGGPVVTIAPGVTDVTIEGLRVQNASLEGILAGAGADRLALEQVAVTASGADGIRLAGVAGARLDLCVLERNAGDGLDVAGDGARASRVTARSNGGAALVLRGLGARVSDLVVVGGPLGVLLTGASTTIERCRFLGTATGVRFGDGSWGNRLETCDVQGGVTAVEATPGSASATVVGVVAQGLAGDAVRLAGDSHEVLDCKVADGDGHGVVLSGTGSRVEGCDVRRVLGEGLRLEGDGHVAADNRVDTAAAEGIHVASGRGDELTGNVVVRCGGQGIADDGTDTRWWGNRID